MKIWAFLSVLLLCSTGALAQDKDFKISHIINPKKVYMKTPGNRDKDSLIIPVVSDKYPALKQALSEDSLFNGNKLESIINEYEKTGHGLSGLDYKITYQDKRIISIIIDYETMDAHPDSYQLWLTLDIVTGKQYQLSNEITTVGLLKILSQYKYHLTNQIASTRKEMVEDQGLDKGDVDYITNKLKTSTDTLKLGDVVNNYVFTTTGVKIKSARVLPYVYRRYETWREYSVTFAKLRRYKKLTALVIK